MYVLECKPMLIKEQPRAQYMQDPTLCACRRLVNPLSRAIPLSRASIPELKLGGEIRENLQLTVPGYRNNPVIKPQRL